MADPNLEAFYSELDARMAMPDDDDWHNFSEHRPNSSGSSELLPPIDNQVPRAESAPTTIVGCSLFVPPIENLPHTVTHGSSKRKASPGPEQPLSEKRGKRSSTPIAGGGHETVNTPLVTSTPASVQDVTSIIEEFTDVMVESPATKRVSGAKSKSPILPEETSVITTPGSTDARSRSKASVVRPKPSMTTTATAKQSAARKKTAKAKPELVTPAEFARRLQEQAVITDSLPSLLPQASDADGRKGRQSSAKLPIKAVRPPQYLKDHVIFYTGGDLTYASARTRGCMNYIHKHGGTVLPKFDPTTATHIVTETNEKNTIRALGLKSLSEIPPEIPTVYWSWVISGKAIPGERDKQQMDYEFMHAAFPSRMDAGRPLTDKGKGKQKLVINEGQALQPGETSPRAASPNPSSRGSSCGIDEEAPGALLVQPPPETRKGRDIPVTGPNRRRSRSPPRAPDKSAPQKKRGGYICDDPTRMAAANSAPCVNQDIVDKLNELAKLHRAKPTQDDKWRVFSYTKAIAALRRCSERISSVEQAMSFNGVGEKTALKIMEIVETGALQRVDAERTEDVAVVQLFQGIYGVGQSTAYAWYSAGCRTLEDIKKGKYGIKLSQAQVLGLKYYEDINSRMPREEASEIFGEIKTIALSLDPKLFVEIMGSYRRGKSTCGDIDVMITRSPDDGRTHVGIVPKLLSALRTAGIVTEDLSLSSDARDSLECTYRGLCVRPMKAGQEDTQPRIRRRIDILAIPWESRGAALLYFTGDDIFNRSMRLKANKMGYSLNQRGLFGGIVRSIGDRAVKTNAGYIIASETEADIFRILGVPWVEPHERVVRG